MSKTQQREKESSSEIVDLTSPANKTLFGQLQSLERKQSQSKKSIERLQNLKDSQDKQWKNPDQSNSRLRKQYRKASRRRPSPHHQLLKDRAIRKQQAFNIAFSSSPSKKHAQPNTKTNNELERIAQAYSSDNEVS